MNPQIMTVKALVKSLNYHIEVPLSETRGEFYKDRCNAYHTSICMFFINKYLLTSNQRALEFIFPTITSKLCHSSLELELGEYPIIAESD